jgi:hypothetical protein
MDQLTIEGIVPDSFKNQKEFYLSICEKDRERAKIFFKQCKTNLRSDSIAVRKQEFINYCKAGDRISYTLEYINRSNGLGVRGIKCEKVK